MTTLPGAPDGYAAWLGDLKTRIRTARLRAALAVNAELIGLYWQIGRDILERERRRGWGARIVDRLAADLKAEFPNARGFSSANLRYMKSFAAAWPDLEICQRVVGKLPWGQNIELLAVKDPTVRRWYAEATLAYGWSRPMLASQISTNLHARQGQALTNFSERLPPDASDLARQTLKDPYQFDFLTLDPMARERDLEGGLLTRIRDLLLELGKGFAFLASQHRLEVGGQEYFVDLLFYHRRLRCLVAIDLKMGDFRPEHAGKMNFYLAALDDREREPGDNPSIGLILCRQRNRLVVEYTLRGVATPIGVARYQLAGDQPLPPELADALPTQDELASGLLAGTPPDETAA
jgi:predicted nuclease of restriction endonuclease-like (RecB) superfamily